MVRTNCSVYGCYATSKNKELKFHRFPQDERAQSWIAACQRPDLINKTAKQLYNMHVCSLHFEKWMYINKKLKDATLPSLNLPNTRAMEQVGAQTIQIVEDSIRGGIKSENDATSLDLAAVPSTSAKTPTKQKKKPKKTIYRITSLKTKEVVFNIHQYYQNRKWDTKNWEYEVDLNINNQVSKITGLSEGTVRKIVRDCRVFKPNVKTTAERAQSASDDSESQIPDLPVTVKIEVDEEDISEHEDDIMEKLENKKRMQEEDPIAVDAKKVRVELVPVADTELEPPQYQVIVQPQQSQGQSQSQYVGVLQPPLQQKIAPKATQPQAQQQPDASEPIVIPEFFMNVVVRNQNEILSILKRQVLLQDPDPELLTFLRFLGSKLLRLPKNKRDELQDRITEMLYKE